MGLGNEAGPEQLGERGGVDCIGLHLGMGDRLQDLRIRQVKVNALGGEGVTEPIPAARRFHHGLMGTGELGEVSGQEAPIVRKGHLARPLALPGERGEHGAAAMLMNAGIEHGTFPSVIDDPNPIPLGKTSRPCC
jgi:hypothetical protein